MTTLEMVERLRERADVTFEEAKTALDEANGDLLDALILLERQGKTTPPPRGGAYSDKHEPDGGDEPAAHAPHSTGADFAKRIWMAAVDLVRRGNSTYVDASRRGKTELSCPVTVFVILLLFGFWCILPLMVAGMFFGWKYRMRGTDFGTEDINSIIEKAENAAESIKNSINDK
jgi:Translation elongation factor Ts